MRVDVNAANEQVIRSRQKVERKEREKIEKSDKNSSVSSLFNVE